MFASQDWEEEEGGTAFEMDVNALSFTTFCFRFLARSLYALDSSACRLAEASDLPRFLVTFDEADRRPRASSSDDNSLEFSACESSSPSPSESLLSLEVS